jgi:hypothetical protein
MTWQRSQLYPVLEREEKRGIVLATEDICSKKGSNDGSPHLFSSPYPDQAHDGKVTRTHDSRMQFPTFLSITQAQKERVRR